MDNKILLVDDEEGIRKVLGISLADIGYEVLSAENGAQAFEIFKKELPPIVLTDIKMPVMDGITLLKRVKQENPDTEVIMLTGHGDMDLAIKCLKLQALDFITKPINADVLAISLTRAHEKIVMKQKLREYTLNLEKMVEEKSARLVEAERLAAVGQAMEGLSSAFKNIAGDLSGSIKYFNEMPCLVSIHSRQLKIIAANQLHQDRLGDLVGRDLPKRPGTAMPGRDQAAGRRPVAGHGAYGPDSRVAGRSAAGSGNRRRYHRGPPFAGRPADQPAALPSTV
jgi:CheY-like chemotaxis protein